jgi:hypothetical protein
MLTQRRRLEYVALCEQGRLARHRPIILAAFPTSSIDHKAQAASSSFDIIASHNMHMAVGHVRSASVPCHSHPVVMQVEDQLVALRSWTSYPG